MKFEKFHIAAEIKDNLQRMGFFRTTDIQYKTIPAILNGEDVLAVAQTGTGKTAAFAIPIIHEIHAYKSSKRSSGLLCLILVPTRELAKQIGHVLASLSKGTKANTYAVYGGVEMDPQIQQLASGIDILVATPGRMFDLIHKRIVDISHTKILVLDEADRMLDLGFINDIQAVKSRLPKRHQTLFFSATINPQIKKLAYSQIRANALRIQVSPEEIVSKNVSHFVAHVPLDDKRHLLLNFLTANPTSKTLVFVRTQVRAERVVAFLEKSGVRAYSLHGGMLQSEREKSLNEFAENKQGVLIATDVSARGIDIPGISHVINYDVPDIAENYVHRVGRTGRGFAKGDAVTFCSPEEDDKFADVEEFLGKKIEEISVDERALSSTPPQDIASQSVRELLESAHALVDGPRSKKPKKRR